MLPALEPRYYTPSQVLKTQVDNILAVCPAQAPDGIERGNHGNLLGAAVSFRQRLAGPAANLNFRHGAKPLDDVASGLVDGASTEILRLERRRWSVTGQQLWFPSSACGGSTPVLCRTCGART